MKLDTKDKGEGGGDKGKKGMIDEQMNELELWIEYCLPFAIWLCLSYLPYYLAYPLLPCFMYFTFIILCFFIICYFIYVVLFVFYYLFPFYSSADCLTHHSSLTFSTLFYLTFSTWCPIFLSKLWTIFVWKHPFLAFFSHVNSFDC